MKKPHTMYKKIDVLFSKEVLCAKVYIKSNLQNKLDLLYFGFVFCFQVYLVFEYSMEFFAKVQFCSLVRHQFRKIPVYWK